MSDSIVSVGEHDRAATHTLAAVCLAHGDGSAIEVRECSLAPVGPTDVVVDVELAGLGHSDALVVADRYQVKAPVPFVPGSEFAGVVVGVGADVVTPAVGDRVVGTMFVGACAQRVVAPARAVTVVPEGLDATTAIAGGVNYATSYHALRSVAALRAGETVLVLGAAGGVGLAR